MVHTRGCVCDTIFPEEFGYPRTAPSVQFEIDENNMHSMRI